MDLEEDVEFLLSASVAVVWSITMLFEQGLAEPDPDDARPAGTKQLRSGKLIHERAMNRREPFKPKADRANVGQRQIYTVSSATTGSLSPHKTSLLESPLEVRAMIYKWVLGQTPLYYSVDNEAPNWFGSVNVHGFRYFSSRVGSFARKLFISSADECGSVATSDPWGLLSEFPCYSARTSPTFGAEDSNCQIWINIARSFRDYSIFC